MEFMFLTTSFNLTPVLDNVSTKNTLKVLMTCQFCNFSNLINTIDTYFLISVYQESIDIAEAQGYFFSIIIGINQLDKIVAIQYLEFSEEENRRGRGIGTRMCCDKWMLPKFEWSVAPTLIFVYLNDVLLKTDQHLIVPRE